MTPYHWIGVFIVAVSAAALVYSLFTREGKWVGWAIAIMTGLALMLLAPRTARAGDPWDTGDKVLGTTAAIFLIRDWGQTRYIAKHPDEYYERNKILGEHPSVGKVDRYFVGYLLGGYLLADWLSPHNRKAFLLGISIVEITVTEKNKSIGVRVDF